MSTSATLAPAPSSSWNLGLFFFRLAAAFTFLYHGCAILFGMFAGPGPVNFAAFMHMPAIVGYLVGLAQFAGGIAILLGALIRIGAACTAIVMLGAIFLVHLPHGFDISKGGMEFALAELLISVGLLCTGPGKYSVASLLPTPLRNF